MLTDPIFTKKKKEIFDQTMAPIIRDRQAKDAQRRAEDAVVLDAAGRVIGGAIKQMMSEPQQKRGTSTQQQLDEFLGRENQRARDEERQRYIRGFP